MAFEDPFRLIPLHENPTQRGAPSQDDAEVAARGRCTNATDEVTRPGAGGAAGKAREQG